MHDKMESVFPAKPVRGLSRPDRYLFDLDHFEIYRSRSTCIVLDLESVRLMSTCDDGRVCCSGHVAKETGGRAAG